MRRIRRRRDVGNPRTTLEHPLGADCSVGRDHVSVSVRSRDDHALTLVDGHGDVVDLRPE
jgi:hypothetical protein